MNKTAPTYLRDAMIMGRVQRLLGHRLSVNPYPERSKRWLAFREGWFQSRHDSLGTVPKTLKSPSVAGEGGTVRELRR